jgi:predicted solute-binding protein
MQFEDNKKKGFRMNLKKVEDSKQEAFLDYFRNMQWRIDPDKYQKLLQEVAYYQPKHLISV